MSDIPMPKVAEEVERSRRRMGQVEDAQHGQKSKRKGNVIE
jgi:hypothetical protein